MTGVTTSSAPAAAAADGTARNTVQSTTSGDLGQQPLGSLDGRYRSYVAPLAQHLSEAALNRERLRVEVEWLVHLAATRAVPGLRRLTDDEVALLRGVAD